RSKRDWSSDVCSSDLSRHFGELDPAKIGGFAKQEKQFPEPGRPRKLLDHVRDVLRVNHYSPRTEEAYLGWIRRFILFHNKKHPRSEERRVGKECRSRW